MQIELLSDLITLITNPDNRAVFPEGCGMAAPDINDYCVHTGISSFINFKYS